MNASEFPRWILEVRGVDTDLSDAAAIFTADADPQVQQYDQGPNTFYGMTSTQFSTLARPREVHEIGLRLLGIINGVLFVRNDRRRPLALGEVRQQNANGSWNHVIVVQTGHYEISGGSVGVVISNTPLKEPPYAAWTALANSNDRVSEVLIHLSGEPDWFSLYNAFEIMRIDINERFGQHQQAKAGWPDKSKLDYFTESATVYRHSSEKWGRYTPNTAMTLRDGGRFIRELTEIWLRNRQ